MDSLKIFLTSGILNANDVEDSIKEDLMKTLLKEVHDLTKIKKPTENFPYWYTYVYEGEGKEKKRKKLFEKTEKKLLEKLVKFYALGNEKNPAKMTFKELYFEWVEYKKKTFVKRSPSTFKKYKTDYKSQIADSPIEKLRLCDLNETILTELLIELVLDREMKVSTFKNIYSYFNMALEYAYKHHYILNNLMDFVEKTEIIQYAYDADSDEDDDSDDEEIRVFTIEEKALILKAVWEHETKYPTYMPDYAIELAFLTGMRVSELAALKWKNIKEDFIYIRLAEHRNDYDDRPSEKTIGLPKKKKKRKFPMTDELRELFARIQALGMENPEGYVFVDENGKRYEASTISCASFRRGKEAGIPKASIHRIRRTVSSELNAVLPRATVAALLGHTEKVNRDFYDYDVTTLEEKLDALKKVNGKFSKFSNIVPFEEGKKIAKAL